MIAHSSSPSRKRIRRDAPNAQVHVLDAGHFAFDTAADEIAELVRGFVGSSSRAVQPAQAS
jgi:pimeloyl-ACP methyl ester carboxylesterase